MRTALLLSLLAACSGSGAAAQVAPSRLRIAATAAPDCNYVMTVPPLPGARATIDKAGNVELEVFAYVQVPVTSTVAAPHGDLEVEITSTAPEEVYCRIPLEISGVSRRPSSVLVRVHHGGGRPLTELRTAIP